MPHKNHVSTFVVWQAEPRGSGGQPGGPAASTDAIRSAMWEQARITFSTSSAFADYARRNNLGAPITNESDIGGYRAQGYANGIVFAPIGQWQSINHLSW